mmetsp:Transcript_1302/g.3445  ORF Transcript_1302/g.3445 Transcript_1302/m.3445 type:complete len:454 (-) Transcript_1302:62-1423(-)
MAPTPTMGAKLVAEGLGTAVLMFTVGCNVLSGNKVWGSTSIACSLMVGVYALGGISGANFNPAVSASLAISKAMKGPGLDLKEAGTYCIVQILAGVVAAFAYTFMFWDDFNLTPAAGFGWVDAMVCEILYTFMLCFVVLNTAAAKGNTPNQFYGLAIGFVIIAAGVYGAGMASGGCFNPAVAIGIDVSSLSKGFGWCVVFLIWELIGAALAAVLFKVVRPEEFGGEKGPAAELASEFLGTYMLVVTVGLNVMGRTPDGAFSIAASLMSMIYALGNVSGAHFNPAVTVAILASGRCPDLTPAKAGQYIGAQVLGAMLAALTYSGIYNGASFKLGPGAGFGYGEVAIAELVFTFLLCYVVLCVAVSETTKAPQMFGLAIASCLTCGVNAIGSISGGSLNPAVSVGIATGHRFGDGSFGAAIAFSLVELIAAGVAAGAFMATHGVDKQADKLEASA